MGNPLLDAASSGARVGYSVASLLEEGGYMEVTCAHAGGKHVVSGELVVVDNARGFIVLNCETCIEMVSIGYIVSIRKYKDGYYNN